jgi:hypothetical protein
MPQISPNRAFNDLPGPALVTLERDLPLLSHGLMCA